MVRHESLAGKLERRMSRRVELHRRCRKTKQLRKSCKGRPKSTVPCDDGLSRPAGAQHYVIAPDYLAMNSRPTISRPFSGSGGGNAMIRKKTQLQGGRGQDVERVARIFGVRICLKASGHCVTA